MLIPLLRVRKISCGDSIVMDENGRGGLALLGPCSLGTGGKVAVILKDIQYSKTKESSAWRGLKTASFSGQQAQRPDCAEKAIKAY